MTNKEKLIQKIDELKQELVKYENELAKKDDTGWGRVEKDKEYLYISYNGTVSTTRDNYGNIDDSAYNSANYNTNEEYLKQIAFEETLRRKMLRYRDLNDEGEVDLKEGIKHKYYIYYDNDMDKLAIHSIQSFISDDIYFNSEEIAENCLEEFRDELEQKYRLNKSWGGNSLKILYLNRDKRGHFKAVFDKIPRMTYEKIHGGYVGSVVLGGEVIFSHYLCKSSYAGAFAGREISLKMKDGTTEKIKDYWYDSGHYHKDIDFISIGAGMPNKLKECYVYCNYNINKNFFKRLVDEYLRKNKVYDYYEIQDLLRAKDTWYPVVFFGKEIPYMINKKGDMVEKWTKKRVYAMHNKIITINGKSFQLKLFKFEYKDDSGKLIKLEAKYSKVMADSIK